MNRILTATLAAATATVMSVSGASATIFAKDYHGQHQVWNAYDTDTQTYSMKFKDDGSKDGFWLVVSPGPNPKTNVDEYAILYGDRATNRITAYTYDGQNSADSFRTGDYLGTFENAFQDGGNGRTMFALDVSDINAALDTPEWAGVQFGVETGIWFHQSSGSNFAYNADGTIADYSFGGQMWLDTANQHTSVRSCITNPNAFYCKAGTQSTGGGNGNGGSVPAPGGLALVLMGLAGFGLRRKK